MTHKFRKYSAEERRKLKLDEVPATMIDDRNINLKRQPEDYSPGNSAMPIDPRGDE